MRNVLLTTALLVSSCAFAGDTSLLRPPAGAKVALFEFEDLQCPQCAAFEPVVKQAAATYKIPWVRHDFPLPMHNWSFKAAVWARWFDANKSKAMGDELREYFYKNQMSVNPDNLLQHVQKFAAERKVELPFTPDPSGDLTKKIKDDQALGNRVGVEHTPSLWVVGDNKNGAPFIEVREASQLYQAIDQMKEQVGSASAKSTTGTGSATKKPAKTAKAQPKG